MTLPIGQRAGLTITTRPTTQLVFAGERLALPVFTIKRVSIGFVLIDLCHCCHIKDIIYPEIFVSKAPHMFNLKRCALRAVSATIFSAQAQLADENGSQQIEEISVIGQFVPDEKRSTDAVANVVNSEEFTRTGDANIAESLKRVAGLSTVGGKCLRPRSG